MKFIIILFAVILPFCFCDVSHLYRYVPPNQGYQYPRPSDPFPPVEKPGHIYIPPPTNPPPPVYIPPPTKRPVPPPVYIPPPTNPPPVYIPPPTKRPVPPPVTYIPPAPTYIPPVHQGGYGYPKPRISFEYINPRHTF